jgi:Glycosyl hydrolase family 20, catalytic domain
VAAETLALIGDLYREVAAIFSAPYLHGGCDEVNWGGSALSQRALQTKSRAQIWAEYVNALDEVCRQLGKELIIWGDAALHRDPDILARLDKRVIVMDWQYQALDPRPLARVARRVVADGRRVLGAPAVISCAWGPRPGERQLRNIEAFAEAYGGISDPRCLGIVVTNWVPTRYVQRSLWDSFAYVGVALGHGSEAARHSGFRRFVERFYGADWNSTWEWIFETYYRLAPGRRSCAPSWPGGGLVVPWANEPDVLRSFRAARSRPSPYAALRERLSAVGDRVLRHRDDFSAFTLSVDYLDHVFWREAVLGAAAMTGGRPSISAVLENVAARDHQLVERLDADWATGRFSDAPGKLDPLPGLEPADQLHYTMRRAAAFSAELAGDGRRVQRLTDAPRPGGGPTR